MPPVTTQNPRITACRPDIVDPAMDGDHYGSGDLVLATTARGFIPSATGNLIVDFAGGGIDGRTPSTNVTIAVNSGWQYNLCFTKIYNTSVAGTILY